MYLRVMILPFALALVVTACADLGDGSEATSSPTGESTFDYGVGSGSLPSGPSALRDQANPELPTPLIDPAEIISGGPPPDGIPSIDEPFFIPIGEADEWLDDREPVVYLTVAGEVHAYPVQVLIWHEIVNDVIGGEPVVVTYCPLCNSAVSYSRVINGVTTTFGTSGRLFASALVMYDRATESLWTHFDGRAVVGVLTGDRLEPISSPLLAWSDFKTAFPDGLVLDRSRTGIARPYGTNPYFGYDDPNTVPFLFRGTVDERARAKVRVVGVAIDGAARAWTFDAISGEATRATNATVGDTPVVILWKAGQASALETDAIADGRDVGSVGVFSPIVDGRLLNFSGHGTGFVDAETATVWDITGSATGGALAGRRLEAIPHLDTFWFSWSTYQPGTDLVER